VIVYGPPSAFFAVKSPDALNVPPPETLHARIKEIALRLGYENVGHFTRIFVKETGMSPREFRRRNAG
jgi:AraC-like DNA-binding protein